MLTKDELQSGWISLNRAQLSWSFYLLILSTSLIVLNIVFIYTTVKLKQRSTSTSLVAKIINSDSKFTGVPGACLINAHGTDNSANDYQQLDELNTTSKSLKRSGIPHEITGFRSSLRAKKIINFVY